MSNPVLAELQSLRQELASLSVRVLALEERLADTGSTAGAFSSPVTVNYVTSGGTGYPEVPPFPTFERSFSSPGSGQSSPPVRGSPGGLDISEAERRAAAVAAGEFLRRALSGEHRGTSGRSRIPLPSTVYVLCKDRHNRTYNPVRIVQRLDFYRVSKYLGSSTSRIDGRIALAIRWSCCLKGKKDKKRKCLRLQFLLFSGIAQL